MRERERREKQTDIQRLRFRIVHIDIPTKLKGCLQQLICMVSKIQMVDLTSDDPSTYKSEEEKVPMHPSIKAKDESFCSSAGSMKVNVAKD